MTLSSDPSMALKFATDSGHWRCTFRQSRHMYCHMLFPTNGHIQCDAMHGLKALDTALGTAYHLQSLPLGHDVAADPVQMLQCQRVSEPLSW
eukprot:1088612-Rhodomonas_salina.4